MHVVLGIFLIWFAFAGFFIVMSMFLGGNWKESVIGGVLIPTVVLAVLTIIFIGLKLMGAPVRFNL